VCVVPTNILPHHREEEQAPDSEGLILSGRVQAGHENIGKEEVDRANDGHAGT